MSKPTKTCSVQSGEIMSFRQHFRRLLRRWFPLIYLLPIALLLRPVFWTILDSRFYNYFQSKRAVPVWEEVVVVGIDAAARKAVFDPPVFPLSRHVRQHAELTRQLDSSGVRAMVFDLEFGSDNFSHAPLGLAEAFRSAGNVFLVISLGEEIDLARSGRSRVIRPRHIPDSVLVRASQGAFVAEVPLDPDGVVRRFASKPVLARMGLETLPERLAGRRIAGRVPILFPSVARPVPTVPYADILAGDADALAQVRGRIAFVGAIGSSATDLVSVPQLQDLGDGKQAYQLPGVMVLAAATETLLRGAPLRDASAAGAAAWVALWSLIVVTVLPRRRPGIAVLVLFGLTMFALLTTALFHVVGNVVFPAGLLLGAMGICGTYTLVTSFVSTMRELHREEIANEQTRREMERARHYQEQFLPRSIPQVEGLQIWGVNISSAAVSGDYFDVIDLQESGRLVIAIADVSGKGLPAALVMSNVQAVLHSNTLRGEFDLKAATTNLNHILSANTDSTTFVTMFLGEIDKRSMRLRYIRAGHDYPLLVSQGNGVQWLRDGDMPFGFFQAATHEVHEVQLRPGDLLCLYTDGVTEARNAADEEFREEGLVEVVTANSGRGPREICTAIQARVEAFSGLTRQADDVTLLVVRVCDMDSR